MNQLFVFYENFQCLIIDENLNKKFCVSEFRTLMFKTTNVDQ